MKKVIILAGPGGVGKTTIAKLIEKECNYVFLDGDNQDTEFFPDGGQWLPENSEQLRKAHNKILDSTKALTDSKKKVVVDYIVFGHYLEFFHAFSKVYGDDLQIVVLFPTQVETIIRDRERECWTAGKERIAEVYSEYENIKDDLGKDVFIDTSGQTPEGTLEFIKNT
jgi:adenylate kinase family enzyme